MAVDYQKLLKRLNNIQKEIHQALNDFRTLEEWEKEEPLSREAFII